MRDYGKVYGTFWSSETTGTLTDDGKMLALYLMTCQHATITGVFRLPDGYAAEDLRWSPERVSEGFAELFRKGFANRCGTTKWVWIRKHLEWNPLDNPNMRKAAAKIALSIPAECAWKLDFMRACAEVLALEVPKEPNRSETVPDGFLNQEQEQEQKQEPPSGVAPAKPSRPARKCPDSFAVTDDLVQWAKAECPRVSIAVETAKFRDHTFATARTDWPGTWRNWMRKAAEDRKGSGKVGASSGGKVDIFEGLAQ